MIPEAVCDHAPSPNPRNNGCVKCGRVREAKMRPRNPALEREIVQLAATAVGRLDDAGLSNYADHRALPGGIRTDQDWTRHALEELADCRNYLCWDAEDHWEGYLAGDPEAGERVARNLTALSGLIEVWDGLVRR